MKLRNSARITVSALIATCLVAAPLSATAGTDENVSSYAQGQFLSGTIAGMNLDTIVDLAGATARNDGTEVPKEVRNPLSATALSSLRVASTPVKVTGVDGVTVGAVGQYARASAGGESFASAGAIGDDGAISVNPGSEGSARIQLAPLLGSRLTQDIANLSLSAEAIGAQAHAELSGVDSDYTLAGLKLNFEVPAAKSLTSGAHSVLRTVEQKLATLAGSTGSVAKAVDRVLRQHSAKLGILGSTAKVTVTVDANLSDVVDSAMKAVLRDAAIVVDLKSGAVSVDLAKLPSTQKLNGMAPGTELLSQAVVTDIVGGVMRLVSNHLDGVEKALQSALVRAAVVVHAKVSVLDRVKTGDRAVETVSSVTQVVDKVTGKVLGILNTDTGVITSLVPGITGSDLNRALNGVLSGLLANLLGLKNGVVAKVVETVETSTEPVFSMLETSVNLRLNGTVDQFRTGAGLHSRVDVKLLGAKVNLGAGLFTKPVSDVLRGTLLAPTSSISRSIRQLSTSMTRPLGSAIQGGGPSSLQSLLGSAISLKVNVQETVEAPGGGSNFTQSALRVSVLDDLATLSLANATVGLNSANGGGGSGPNDDGTDPGNDPAAGLEPSGGGSLAFTGAEWAGLAILVALALAAIGGGFALRRRHSKALGADVASEDLLG